jgi:hypothetical protein
MNLIFLLPQRILKLASQLLHLHTRRSPAVPAPHAAFQSRLRTPKFIADYATPARATGQFSSRSSAKPLRVVRVVESGQPRASVGRMVISGRMADVCAELDRLAACEAALN